MIWNEAKECMSRDEMTHLQNERLCRQVEHVYHNVPFYRAKMQAIGLEPGDIHGLEDLPKLPFTTKEDLRTNYPFGLFAVPMRQVVRVHASSGTTGKSTVVGYTRKDLATWKEIVTRVLSMAEIDQDDRIQVAYGYGLFTGGLGLHYGAENLGATVIPMSTSNTNKLITMMIDMEATCIACTPSYLLHVYDVLKERDLLDKIKLKTAILGAEPWTKGMRHTIEESLNIHAYDIYGLSEIMGPGVAADCAYHDGLHIAEDYFYPEIIDPHTLKPVEEGEVGELCFTTLNKEALPLIRYRTKDLSSLKTDVCRCGRTNKRMTPVMGRTDDMLIIRGVNVFPTQVEAALVDLGKTSLNYLMIVDRVDRLDTLEVWVEVSGEYFSDRISDLERLEARVAKQLKRALGLTVKVRLVEPHSLERQAGKQIRVLDKRQIGKTEEE